MIRTTGNGGYNGRVGEMQRTTTPNISLVIRSCCKLSLTRHAIIV